MKECSASINSTYFSIKIVSQTSEKSTFYNIETNKSYKTSSVKIEHISLFIAPNSYSLLSTFCAGKQSKIPFSRLHIRNGGSI